MQTAQGTSTFFYAIWGLWLLIALLTLWMVIDTQRVKRRVLKDQYNLPTESLSLYTIIGGVLVLVALLGYASTIILFIPEQIKGISFLARFPMIIVLVVYLARVVLDPRVRPYWKHHLGEEPDKDSGKEQAEEPVKEQGEEEPTQ